MFVDQVKVFARAGHGGKGCIAFHREAFAPKGGPSGGNGGRGGDVVLEADHDLNNLVAQFYQPRLLAENGAPGMGKGMDGRFGKPKVVKVPCGTLVWRLTDQNSGEDEPAADAPSDEHNPSQISGAASGEKPSLVKAPSGEMAWELDMAQETDEPTTPGPAHDKELLADLTEHGQRFVLCSGGRGGLGNRNFATARRQTPRFAQPGEAGEEGHFLFELRLMADVGLVGYPNAGKSTLLSAISKAHPKIAPYPFTTLHPQVGIVEFADFHRLVVCDVPGLIAGAHRNVGLGHAFLRHIRRCRALVLLLDMAGTDGRDPWDDFQQLLEELSLYDPSLLERPRLVAANKMDEPAAPENLTTFSAKHPNVEVLPLAAAFGQGVETFTSRIRSLADKPEGS